MKTEIRKGSSVPPLHGDVRGVHRSRPSAGGAAQARLLADRAGSQAYIIERENERFLKSALTALSPRAARYDNRLKFRFVDFEEL